MIKHFTKKRGGKGLCRGRRPQLLYQAGRDMAALGLPPRLQGGLPSYLFNTSCFWSHLSLNQASTKPMMNIPVPRM